MQVRAHQPKLVVTSSNTFWDSKEAVEGQLVQDDFLELKDSKADQVEIGAAIYNEPLAAKLLRKAPGAIGTGVGAGLVAGAVAFTVGMSLPGALFLGGALALSRVVGMGLEALAERWKFKDIPEGLALPHTSQQGFTLKSDGSSPSDALQALGAHHLKEYPSSFHVLHMNGHGHGAKAVAGLSGDAARKAALEAVVAGGRKFDVAFYETCYGSNFEFLYGQAGAADFAVAFEDQAPKSNSYTKRVPVDEILAVPLELMSPREAAQGMAARAGEHFEREEPPAISKVPLADRLMPEHRDKFFLNTDSTVVAVDLQELQADLAPQLDKVGRLLVSAYRESPEVKNLVHQARRKNKVDEVGDLVDMGGFLTDIRKGLGEREPELAAAIGSAERELGETIIGKRTGKDFPLSGLTFHTRPNAITFRRPASSAYENEGLPKNWVGFVEEAFLGLPVALSDAMTNLRSRSI